MDKGLKEKIIKLFLEGKNYNEIKNELKCSKGTISYHCSKLRPVDNRYSRKNIQKYQKHYDSYRSVYLTAKYFKVSASTLKNYLKLRKIKYTSEESKKRRSKSVIDWRRRIKKRAVDCKGGECQNCGYKKSVFAMDFHHTDPKNKDYEISKNIRSWEKTKIEIEKCILVCKNCHYEIHEEIFMFGFSEIVNNIIKKSSIAQG